jgi:UDP-N-acetylglucosamine 2-epimerase (non-hydrolysing)
MKLLTIIGTRPEAVKMAPVLLSMRAHPGIRSLLCTTGQHSDLLDEPLSFFGIVPDFSLQLMDAGQSLGCLVARSMLAIDELLQKEMPDRVLVHGDTATSLAAAHAAFCRQIPVAHVEAGLRTYRHSNPWPEEQSRRTIDLIADRLFAPTAQAARNLADERVDGQVSITGNSGIDALHLVIDRLTRDPALRSDCDALLPDTGDRPLILATVHRRESIGEGVAGICRALSGLAARGRGEVALPVHPNPAGEQIRAALSGRSGIHLLPPLPLPAMVRLMQRSDLILTDSGGVQEEAPTLGKPVLVLREVTERPEGVHAGLARLTGTCPDRIIAEAEAALARVTASPLREVVPNPYGDGRAAGRIVAGLLGESVDRFAA